MANLNVDFFRVRIEPDGPLFENVIDTTIGLGAKARNLQFHADILRLQTAQSVRQTREGDMTRIRMTDLPLRVKADGSIAEIDFDVDEGLGEQSAFLYHIPTETLAVQRNRYSVTPGNLAYYFMQMAAPNSVIFLDPVLEEDTIQRMANMEVVRRFQVKFARVDNPTIFEAQGRSLKDFADTMTYFQSPSANFELSMGQKRGSLPVRIVKMAANALNAVRSDSPRNKVAVIELRGTDAEGNPDILDLVEDRMMEEVEVEAQGRHARYPARRAAVREAFGNREQELRRLHR
jgi:hypothetical protein